MAREKENISKVLGKSVGQIRQSSTFQSDLELMQKQIEFLQSYTSTSPFQEVQDAVIGKRHSIREAKIDIYTPGKFRVELPNGKKKEITSALVSEIIRAHMVSPLRDDIVASIYPEVNELTKARLIAGIGMLNKIFEPDNYRLVHPPLSEIKAGVPFEYYWEVINPELEQQEDLRPLEKELGAEDPITDEEAFHLANLFNKWGNILAHEEYQIITTEALVKIREKLGEDYSVDISKQSAKEGRLAAINHIKKIARSANADNIDSVCANQPEAYQELLLLAIVEPDTYEALTQIAQRNITQLDIVDRKTGFVKSDRETQYRFPFLTKRERRLQIEKAMPEGKPKVFTEEVEVISEKQEEVVVFEEKPAEIEPEQKESPAMPTKETKPAQEIKYKAIISRDPNVLKTIGKLTGDMLRRYPEGVTTGQIAKDYTIKHSRVIMGIEDGYISEAPADGRKIRRIMPVDAAVLIYMEKYGGDRLSARAKSDVKKMASDMVKETQDKIKKRNGGAK